MPRIGCLVHQVGRKKALLEDTCVRRETCRNGHTWPFSTLFFYHSRYRVLTNPKRVVWDRWISMCSSLTEHCSLSSASLRSRLSSRALQTSRVVIRNCFPIHTSLCWSRGWMEHFDWNFPSIVDTLVKDERQQAHNVSCGPCNEDTTHFIHTFKVFDVCACKFEVSLTDHQCIIDVSDGLTSGDNAFAPVFNNVRNIQG